jgi:high-affinity iron transporter
MRRLVGLAIVVALAGTLAAGTTPAPSPKLIEQGRRVYAVTCAPCHGVDGDGKGPVAFAINPPPRNFRKDAFKAGDSVEQIFATVTNGLPNTKMVGYPQISEDDRWGLAYVVLAFRPAK